MPVEPTMLAARVNAPGLHEHLAGVVRGLKLPLDAAILDLGCGTGAWLERLRALGFSDLLGVDADTAQFGAAGIECLSCDLEHSLPPLDKGPFRLVTAIEVIEHVANTGQFVRSLNVVLSDDGAAILTMPNLHSLAARLRYCLSGRLPEFDCRGEPTHVTPVFLEPLCRLLDREGLYIDRKWTFPERSVGSVWRPAVRLLVGLARTIIADPLPGSLLCVVVRKKDACGT